jgi:hypothetical protein
MGIRLDDDEAWAVLEAAHTGILTTLRADGSPVTLPMWFVALDRTICFTTFEGTKKLARVQRDPRASFLVESGERWAELRAVHRRWHGRDRRRRDRRPRIDAAARRKFSAFRTARSEMPAATGYYSNKRFLRLVPAPASSRGTTAASGNPERSPASDLLMSWPGGLGLGRDCYEVPSRVRSLGT